METIRTLLTTLVIRQILKDHLVEIPRMILMMILKENLVKTLLMISQT